MVGGLFGQIGGIGGFTRSTGCGIGSFGGRVGRAIGSQFVLTGEAGDSDNRFFGLFDAYF